VRERLLSAIERIAKSEASAALAPREPEVKIVESTKAMYNDPALAARVSGVLSDALGTENVLQPQAELAADDFSEYVGAGVRGLLLYVGAVEKTRFQAWKAGGPALPSLHSPLFAPDREKTLRTAVLVETLAAIELLHERSHSGRSAGDAQVLKRIDCIRVSNGLGSCSQLESRRAHN
jgi:hippurate hydrolase